MIPVDFPDFLATALGSDFFAGGLALGVLGVAVAALRLLWDRTREVLERRIWVSLTLDNRSAAYRHFCIWMERNKILIRSRHVRMTDGSWSGGTRGFAPAPGRHWFLRDGRLCRLDRSINEKARIGGSHNQRPLETLTITVLLGKVPSIMAWIEEGRDAARNKDRIGPGLHILRGDYWDEVGDIPRRSIETVLVDDDRVAKLLADLRWFYGANDWYAARGVPWRRGYLLHGPPGTGKSSLIRALASELGLDIAMLDVGRATLTDDDLREAMISAPGGTIIAIEDVDAVFTQREVAEKRAGISFSGLLNAIDGVAAQEGRALIMTTNHIERLDPALIRPGRADVHVELGHINATTARHLFERFFPAEPDLARQFEMQLGAGRCSPAQIQAWLLANSEDPVQAAQANALSVPVHDTSGVDPPARLASL